LSIYKEMA